MFFSENKSYSVVQKKAFFDEKPKMTKKIGFENVEIPKMEGGGVKNGHYFSTHPPRNKMFDFARIILKRIIESEWCYSEQYQNN